MDTNTQKRLRALLSRYEVKTDNRISGVYLRLTSVNPEDAEIFNKCLQDRPLRNFTWCAYSLSTGMIHVTFFRKA
jgi:hypothetical protein